MTVHELWEICPCGFIFIRCADGSVKAYKGGGAFGNRVVVSVFPTSYPMFKNVLEVSVK